MGSCKNMSRKKIAVIGSGITGSIITGKLSSCGPASSLFDVTLFDKARGAGGRASVKRYKDTTADIGLQYITHIPTRLDDCGQKIFRSLLNSKEIVPFKSQDTKLSGFKDFDKYNQYIAPQGSNRICSHFLKEFSDVHYQHTIKKITAQNGKWSIQADTISDSHVDNKKEGTLANSVYEDFDTIVLTMPAPQISQLLINSKIEDDTMIRKLSTVQYSSRFVLSMFYTEACSINEVQQLKNHDICRYIEDSEVLRFASFDTLKRRNHEAEGHSIVFHSSVSFALPLLDKDRKEVQEIMEKEVSRILPYVPKPDATRLHMWRYSQVAQSFFEDDELKSKEHKAFQRIEASSNIKDRLPDIYLCGDAFSSYGSCVDGCIQSASHVIQSIQGISK